MVLCAADNQPRQHAAVGPILDQHRLTSAPTSGRRRKCNFFQCRADVQANDGPTFCRCFSQYATNIGPTKAHRIADKAANVRPTLGHISANHMPFLRRCLLHDEYWLRMYDRHWTNPGPHCSQSNAVITPMFPARRILATDWLAIM